jgi:hypothetical protein
MIIFLHTFMPDMENTKSQSVFSRTRWKARPPKERLRLILEWRKLYEKELMEDWELCRKAQTPKPIDPLE